MAEIREEAPYIPDPEVFSMVRAEAIKFAAEGTSKEDLDESVIRAMRSAEKAGNPFELGISYPKEDEAVIRAALKAQSEQTAIRSRSIGIGTDGVALSEAEAHKEMEGNREAA
jgi:hypothetical protein